MRRSEASNTPSDSSLPQPLLYLSAYFEQHRAEYYDHLLVTSQKGDLMPWIAFFLRGVRRQARDSEERTVRLVESMIGVTRPIAQPAIDALVERS